MVRQLSVVFVALVATRAAAALELPELAAKVKPSVVHLAMLSGSGETIGNATGFFLAADGIVVTNEHVVKEASALRATLSDGSQREVLGVISRDAGHDLALVKVEGSGYPPLPLAEDSKVTEGTKVIVVGSPLGLSWTLSEGIISALRQDGVPERLRATREERGPLIQITAPIAPGSSGSPVLTADGEVVGVARSTVLGTGGLSFAVPVQVLREMRDGVPANAAPLPLRSVRVRNLLISLAAFTVLGIGLFVARRAQGRAAGMKVRR